MVEEQFHLISLDKKTEDQGIIKKVLWSAAKKLNVKVDKGVFNDG